MDQWKKDLEKVVSDSKKFTGQRLGQLIYNSIAERDLKQDYPGSIKEYDKEFHSRLYYMEDDKLIELIHNWLSYLKEIHKKY